MFVNEEVYEIVLTVSSCTDYVFSAAVLIFKVLIWMFTIIYYVY